MVKDTDTKEQQKFPADTYFQPITKSISPGRHFHIKGTSCQVNLRPLLTKLATA